MISWPLLNLFVVNSTTISFWLIRLSPLHDATTVRSWVKTCRRSFHLRLKIEMEFIFAVSVDVISYDCCVLSGKTDTTNIGKARAHTLTHFGCRDKSFRPLVRIQLFRIYTCSTVGKTSYDETRSQSPALVQHSLRCVFFTFIFCRRWRFRWCDVVSILFSMAFISVSSY